MPYKQRLKNLQKLLKENKCDALYIDDSVNLFYLTGIHLSAGVLLAHAKGAFLLVDGRYIEMCKKLSPFPVILTNNFMKTLSELLTKKNIKISRLGFNSENTSYKNFLALQSCVEPLSSKMQLLPLDNPVKQLRSIKDKNEIALLKKAAALGSKGFDFACQCLKKGITELEVASELEIFWKREGSKGLAFDPIIAFGANSSMPHYRAGNTKLKNGDTVLIDIGVNLEHYNSDMTRVVYFKKPDPKILEIHDIVEKAQAKALSLCRPGTLIGEIDKAARDFIHNAGYGEFFNHGLGHGVGLDIHEWPVIKNIVPFNTMSLQEGMVITIEPGIYLPDHGGVRIENTIVITKNNYEDLTKRSTKPIVIN